MDQDVYDAQLSENEPKRPRNGMYWVGFIICKSYYESATNKSKAIYEILNIKEYTDFFKNSKPDTYVAYKF